VLQCVSVSCSTWFHRPSPRNSANFVHTKHCKIRPTPHTATHGNTRPNRYRYLMYTTYHNTRHTAVHTTHCQTRPNIPAHCDILQRSTLQHIATHCNTLQHTATYCNILQRTVRQTVYGYNTYQHTTKRYKHTATHCNILQHTATQNIHVLPQIITRQHTATKCNSAIFVHTVMQKL